MIDSKTREVVKAKLEEQKNEELLRKHMEENQRLKRQMKKTEEQGKSPSPV